MKVKVSESSDNSAIKDSSDLTIQTSKASLTYNGQSPADAAQFTYTDAESNTYDFEFNLQYYKPSAGNFPNIAISGAYVFVP